MALYLLIIAGALFLAYANGANDNFKGVATLYGSATASYRSALALATITTLLGSLASLLLAQGLLVAFSGKGLVPDALLQTRSFSFSVGLGAAATVFLATRLGFPISTTHALIGALAGAGALAGSFHLEYLSSTFLLPLLTSPILAIGLAVSAYPLARTLRRRFGVEPDTCVCVGQPELALAPAPTEAGRSDALQRVVAEPRIEIGTTAACQTRLGRSALGLDAATGVDASHYLSAGLVCFARGLNDTPKMAAVLLMATGASALSPGMAVAGIAVCMALGGVLSARKVAHRMSRDITPLNAGQGLAANLVTSALVLAASRLGVPVSTTHVSCGALFGIGLVTGEGRWRTILSILTAWVVTLPLAAATAALFYTLSQ
ncbi:MAG: inorganic phosphate transporter [Candidatus Latescibacteria bacterium]|nr:inorganic phosphate transporter [Candidatus Latescibacterota bacterium]